MIYIDLELTCWQTTPPVCLQPEVIEIAVVKSDLNALSLTREQAYFVRPRRWEVSQECTTLTGITAEDVKRGRPLAEVLALIAEQFDPLPRAGCAWGDDVALLAAKCDALRIPWPLSPVNRSVAALTAASGHAGTDEPERRHGVLRPRIRRRAARSAAGPDGISNGNWPRDVTARSPARIAAIIRNGKKRPGKVTNGKTMNGKGATVRSWPVGTSPTQ